jgi:hypothetical protein
MGSRLPIKETAPREFAESVRQDDEMGVIIPEKTLKLRPLSASEDWRARTPSSRQIALANYESAKLPEVINNGSQNLCILRFKLGKIPAEELQSSTAGRDREIAEKNSFDGTENRENGKMRQKHPKQLRWAKRPTQKLRRSRSAGPTPNTTRPLTTISVRSPGQPITLASLVTSDLFNFPRI